MKQFKITYEMECVLDTDQMWPDGDAPTNPTAKDVIALIRRHGGIYRVLDDWNLHQTCSTWEVHEESNSRDRNKGEE